MSQRNSLPFYILILLATIAFLAVNWPHHSLWYDEALTTWVATGSWDRLFNWCTQVDIQVPLHYIVLRGWVAAVGNSEFSLHLLSALCALLAVAAMIAITRRLLGAKAAVLSPILLAFTPAFLWIAYEVRAYALALALFAWSTVFLLALLESRKAYRWVMVAYSLLTLAMLYTHYTGIAALAAHAVIILWTALSQREQTGRILRRALICGAAIAIGFLPWLPVLFSRGASDRSYYPGSMPPNEALGIIFAFKWLARDDFRWLLPNAVTPSPFSPFIAISLLLVIAAPILWIIKTRQWKPVIYGLAITLLPIMMIVVIVYFRPKLAGRYAWPAWIGIDLLLTCGLMVLSSWRRFSFKAALLLSIVVALLPWLSGQTGHPPRSDFRGAFAYIRDHWHEGDLVILRDGTLFPAADYYHSPEYIGLPESKITDVTHTLQTNEAAEALKNLNTKLNRDVRGVWLLSWQGDVMEPQHIISGLLETISAHQPLDQTFEDIELDYFALQQPPSAIQGPAITDKPLVETPEGLTLYSASILETSAHRPGDSIIVHSWWQRKDTPLQATTTRVSLRLKGSDGTTYGQADQPPTGWVYFPDHWPANSPILGRYAMTIPDNAPSDLSVELVVYSTGNNAMVPFTFPVGTIKVHHD